ncbi:Methyltransferase domain-containing protein [Lachnospiraceae bacterium KH1T2]|nr:Methyltransferase domain-containing protein [Lachnospiraceae bacterium KH1T2]
MKKKEGRFIKKVGKVVLDYEFYQGEDIYSDGEIEDTILEACQRGEEEELLKNSSDWAVLYHLSSIRENLLEWYPLEKNTSVLEIGAGCGALTGILSKKVKTVTCVDLSEKRSLINAYRHKDCDNIEIIIGNFQDIEPSLDKYDYVTLIGVLEYSKSYIQSEEPFLEMLRVAVKHLNVNGKLIIAIENKMGLKYWNGAPEDHTVKMYSGLNDYTDGSNVRTFSKKELIQLLSEAGIETYCFYYPQPDYKLPKAIYSDSVLPKPGDIRSFKKVYSSPRMYNFYEDTVTDQVCADNMFPYFANSFLVVCGEEKNNVFFATYNRERKNKFQIKTEIIEDLYQKKLIAKCALTQEAQEHIDSMSINRQKWEHTLENVCCVEDRLDENNYFAEFVDGVSLENRMYEYRSNPECFVNETKKIIDSYLTPASEKLIPFHVSEKYVRVFGNNYIKGTYSTKYTNVDVLFSNIKLCNDGKLYVYDFEWIFDFPIPYKYPIWRAAEVLYIRFKQYISNQFSRNDFLMELGFTEEEITVFLKMEEMFPQYVCGIGLKEEYTHNFEKICIMQSTHFFK